MSKFDTWLRRLVIIFTIGGSCLVLLMLSASGTISSKWTAAIFIFLALIIAYAVWGLVIGIGIAENRVKFTQLIVWLALQIPCVVAPTFDYRVAIGPQLMVGHYKGSYSIAFESMIDKIKVDFGSSQDPWQIAVNCIPAILIILLMRARPKKPSFAPRSGA